MKRLFTFALVALMGLALCTTVACTKDDNGTNNTENNGGNNGGGTTPDNSYVGTSWRYPSGQYGDATYVDVLFNFYTSEQALVNTVLGTSQQSMGGQYTYSNGSGSIAQLQSLTTGENCGSATFSIDGMQMTFNWNGQSYTLTKQ